MVAQKKVISETKVNKKEVKKKKRTKQSVYKLNTCTIQRSYLLIRKSDKNSCFLVKDLSFCKLYGLKWYARIKSSHRSTLVKGVFLPRIILLLIFIKRNTKYNSNLVNSHQSGDEVHEHHLHFKPLLGALQLLQQLSAKSGKKKTMGCILWAHGLHNIIQQVQRKAVVLIVDSRVTVLKSLQNQDELTGQVERLTHKQIYL